MSNWLRLTTEDLNALDPGEVITHPGDVKIHVYMAPDDLPERVRGDYDRVHGRCVIEFGYLDNEDWSLEQQSEHAWVRVGKHSRRVYGLEIDLETINEQSVGQQVSVPAVVERAFDDLVNDTKRFTRDANYKAAKTIFKRKQALILDQVTCGRSGPYPEPPP